MSAPETISVQARFAELLGLGLCICDAIDVVSIESVAVQS